MELIYYIGREKREAFLSLHLILSAAFARVWGCSLRRLR